jgi:hypothetical protein
MNEGISLALSTSVAPASKFTIDKTEYHLLGPDHLSDDDEAEAMALFSRHAVLSTELEYEKNVVKGKDLALRVKRTRVQILCKLTDVPQDVIEKLPLSAQVSLLEAIEKEISDPEEPEAEGAGDHPPQDD